MLGNLQAQDLIVTTAGDSINCNITKVTKNYVYATFKQKHTAIPINLVATQQKAYFLEQIPETERPVTDTYNSNFPRFRVALDGGGQLRLAKVADVGDDAWQEHLKKLKRGLHYDLQVAYFFTETVGVEAMFSQQLFWNTIGRGTLADENGVPYGTGTCKESVRINYFGANYVTRIFGAKKKNSWLIALGLGYMGYNDRVLFDKVEGLKNTAGTLGVNMSVGYDLEPSETIGLGFKLSIMSGSFRDYKQTRDGVTTNETTPENTFEGLGTVKLSIGLRFIK
jgi:hypothetical protein